MDGAQAADGQGRRDQHSRIVLRVLTWISMGNKLLDKPDHLSNGAYKYNKEDCL